LFLPALYVVWFRLKEPAKSSQENPDNVAHEHAFAAWQGRECLTHEVTVKFF